MSDESSGHTRREFLQLAIAAGIYATVEQYAGAAETGGIPYRALGSTGEKVSIIGVGGYHLGNPDEQTAIRIVRTALDGGINFMDNSWDYHNGESMVRMGKALLGGYRQKTFLMCKTDSHSKDGITKQIDECLKKLQTDHVDLMQFHEVIRMDDPEKIFAPGGALEGMQAAKKAGKVRYIGFTGHKDPKIHLHMLDVAKQHGFHFDTVQMPVSVLDEHFNSFTREVLPRLVDEKIAPLGMKPISAGKALQSKTVTAPECLRFAMSMPVSVVITGCEAERDIAQALKVARDFKPMSETERSALLKKTAQVAAKGKYEEYKTTNVHDSTMQHPEWLA
jgi:predicted aldo/keto reductase-like oxidoreductase